MNKRLSRWEIQAALEHYSADKVLNLIKINYNKYNDYLAPFKFLNELVFYKNLKFREWIHCEKELRKSLENKLGEKSINFRSDMIYFNNFQIARSDIITYESNKKPKKKFNDETLSLTIAYLISEFELDGKLKIGNLNIAIAKNVSKVIEDLKSYFLKEISAYLKNIKNIQIIIPLNTEEKNLNDLKSIFNNSQITRQSNEFNSAIFHNNSKLFLCGINVGSEEYLIITNQYESTLLEEKNNKRQNY